MASSFSSFRRNSESNGMEATPVTPTRECLLFRFYYGKALELPAFRFPKLESRRGFSFLASTPEEM